MRIYVDFDDCLCETGRAFSKLVLEMFNKHVPYDRIHFFELDRSFDLDAVYDSCARAGDTVVV